MRKSTIHFILVGLHLALLSSIFIHSQLSQHHYDKRIETERELVRTLGITDLCLFTEARYTRHPSLADLHSPFQDSPLSFEHFPSGSLMVPPQSLTDFYSGTSY